ncbi:MAG: hypothetical protein Q8O33_04465 [Pseudomonadota bacterium]|nr:hypothetical protein [Pseudomonadota bacterium]
MRIEKTITVGDRAVTVHELTVADIRAWLKSLESPAEPDIVGVALIDGVELADLAIMTDLPVEVIEASSPSELRAVFDACREVNADFFALRGRLETIGKASLASMPGAPGNHWS